MSAVQTPAWVQKTTLDCWDFLSAQLGSWNKPGIIAMNVAMYQRLVPAVIEALAIQASNSQGTDYMWARDGCRINDIWVLAPVSVMEADIVVVEGLPTWDPKHLHVSAAIKRGKGSKGASKVPRPPNAFILFRKDKHKELKETYPDMHNNEISVFVGNMWKSESPEVRKLYHQKSVELRDALLKANPGYRYSPRKTTEIKRRIRTNKSVDRVPSTAPVGNPTMQLELNTHLDQASETTPIIGVNGDILPAYDYGYPDFHRVDQQATAARYFYRTVERDINGLPIRDITEADLNLTTDEFIDGVINDAINDDA